MARRLHTNYQDVYKILKENIVLSNLLTEFEIEDDNFKNVCMFLTTNATQILSCDLKDLYYSQTWSTLEADQASPYVKRFNTVDDLPTGLLVEDGTVYFVRNPIPGSYYKYSALSQKWILDADYTEMTPTEYTEYQTETGHMIWETTSGYFQLTLETGRRVWTKLSNTPSVVKGTVIRKSDLPTSKASIGDIYKVTGEDILDILATYYGYTYPTFVPPWDTIMSSEGTKLTELLYYTIYEFFFISTENFYEKNILNFIPENDRLKMEEKPKIKLFMKGIGKKLDQLEDYISSLQNIYDLDNCPDDVLDYIGQNIGYEKEDFSLNNISFRELLKNIIEIYKVKGTNYSFSFFFKFLGFSINLKEFYFNKDVKNPCTFPGADEAKIEYYLTTTNPLHETTTNKSVKNLSDIKNVNDWDTEKSALDTAGCKNSVQYMLGNSSYNDEGTKYHSNPWTYFKTNLIEYELSPFLTKMDLTASDNETIKKYVKFLSPTYLFTWINVNLSAWSENYEIQEENIITQIDVTLSDPRPTPSPWPSHKPGVNGVPEHTGTWIKKTNKDKGFEGPYLDYEDFENSVFIYGTKLEEKIPIYPYEYLDTPDIFGETILSYYDKTTLSYELKNLTTSQQTNCILYLKRHNIYTNQLKSRIMRNPLIYFEDENIYINKQSYSILDFYNKTSDYYILRTMTEYEKSIAKSYMNIIHRIGDTLITEITNNMNYGGADEVGTILKRDGSTVRQKDHPSYIVNMTHSAVTRLAFDNLGIYINYVGDVKHEYSSQSFPSLPDTFSPALNEIYYHSNNITFDWSDSFGSESYRIQIASDKDFKNIIEEQITNQSNYTTSEKYHNDIYYWRMRVKNQNDINFMDNHTFNLYLDKVDASDKSFVMDNFDIIKYEGVEIGYQIKSNCSDIDRLNSIFFNIGYNWTQWSSTIKFDLRVVPFPFNNEVINKATKYITPTYSLKSVTGPKTYDGTAVTFSWNEISDTVTYQLQINNTNDFSDENSLLVFTTTSTNSFTAGYDSLLSRYYITEGTYYWRYRSYNSSTDYKQWSDVLSFSIYFPENEE